MKVFIVSIVSLFAFQSFALVDWKTECNEEKQPIPFNYCISRPQGSLSKDVLFHFHGLGSSEKIWSTEPFHYSAQLREIWDSKGTEAPLVVSISFGPVWLLVEKNSSVNSGLYEAMTGYILPFLEKKIGGVSGDRILIGESMGGFNASQLFLKTSQLFNRVALLCPAMAELTPFSTEDEIQEYIKRNRANPELVKRSIFLLQLFVPDLAAWQTVSQFALAEKNLSAHSPKLYLSCGSYDEYGFYEGVKKFLAVARKKNVTVEWHPVYGGHCAADFTSLAEFLVPSSSQNAK